MLSIKQLQFFDDEEIQIQGVPASTVRAMLPGDRVITKLIEIMDAIDKNEVLKAQMIRLFGTTEMVLYDTLQDDMTDFYVEVEREILSGVGREYSLQTMELILINRYGLSKYDLVLTRIRKDGKLGRGIKAGFSTAAVMGSPKFQQDYNERTGLISFKF